MYTNDSSQVFKYSIIRLAAVILTTFTLMACGGGGGSDDDGDQNGGDTSTNNEGNTTSTSTLERNFPVSENGALPASLNQSFACIDEIDTEFYELEFTPSGSVNVVNSLTSLNYSMSGNNLSIDVEPVFGPGVSYQHQYHVIAGDLMVGFVGAFTDGFNTASLACIAARHDFSDSVPFSTAIACPSSGTENFTDTSFTSSTTNHFYLEPNHYAQRKFHSETFFSGSTVTSYISASNSTTTEQHGTYLYDQASGEFVMGFMDVDYSNVSVDLLVFEGLTDGTNVAVELGSQTRNCEFE